MYMNECSVAMNHVCFTIQQLQRSMQTLFPQTFPEIFAMDKLTADERRTPHG